MPQREVLWDSPSREAQQLLSGSAALKYSAGSWPASKMAEKREESSSKLKGEKTKADQHSEQEEILLCLPPPQTFKKEGVVDRKNEYRWSGVES